MGLCIMAAVTLVDVVLSKFMKFPLPGATEIVGVTQVFTISAGLAFSYSEKRHIRIGFLLNFLPDNLRKVFEVFASLLSFGFFFLAFLSTLEYANSLLKAYTTTLLIKIPIAPFLFWTSLCCLLLWIILIIEIVKLGRKRK